MGTIVNGSELMAFVGGTSIAEATSSKLSLSADTTDTSSKDNDSGWGTKRVKKLNWSVTSENLVADDGAGKSFDDLFALMIAKTPVAIVFGPQTAASAVPTTGWVPKAGAGYQGNAIITSLEKNAPSGDESTMTVQFDGVGALTPIKATS
jgi:hypothetical protein